MDVFLAYVRKYGTGRVRGAGYTSVYLSAAEHHTIQEALEATILRCKRCQRVGHISDNCPLPVLSCARCGGAGHDEDVCRVARHVDGQWLADVVGNGEQEIKADGASDDEDYAPSEEDQQEEDFIDSDRSVSY